MLEIHTHDAVPAVIVVVDELGVAQVGAAQSDVVVVAANNVRQLVVDIGQPGSDHGKALHLRTPIREYGPGNVRALMDSAADACDCRVVSSLGYGMPAAEKLPASTVRRAGEHGRPAVPTSLRGGRQT